MLTVSHRWKKCTRTPSPADRQVWEEAGHTAQTFPSASPGDAHEAELLLLENRTEAASLPATQPPASGDRTAEISEIFERCFLTGFLPV